MVDWLVVIASIYKGVTEAIQFINRISKISEYNKKEYEIKEIKQDLESGELHFGNQVKVLGTFSEYIPFLDIKRMLDTYKSENIFNFTHTTRINSINDTFCGGLYELDETKAYSENVIPLFYHKDSQILEHFTGEMLELQCKIKQVPDSYANLISNNKSFVFEKEENLDIPFGLEVIDVKPYGLQDTFKVNSWLIGNLNPYPVVKKGGKEICQNCDNSFTFSKIDPLDWPFKLGCKSEKSLEKEENDTVNNTKNFINIYKDKDPYVIFPTQFKLFEIFCPNMDIYNKDEVKKCHSIIKKSIEENIEVMFNTGYYNYLEIPKESTLSVDYQYDQRIKIYEQNLDLSSIPEWVCPNYSYNPDWIKRIKESGIEDVEGYIKNMERKKFKINKRIIN